MIIYHDKPLESALPARHRTWLSPRIPCFYSAQSPWAKSSAPLPSCAMLAATAFDRLGNFLPLYLPISPVIHDSLESDRRVFLIHSSRAKAVSDMEFQQRLVKYEVAKRKNIPH